MALKRRHRELLDERMERRPKEPASTKANDDAPRGDPLNDVSSRMQEPIERDTKNLKPDTPEVDAESKSQPLLQILLSRHAYQAITPYRPIRLLKGASKTKVTFATGGITTGKQALKVLKAGASVAHVYTALVFGGVGVVAQLKDEIRGEMRRRMEE